MRMGPPCLLPGTSGLDPGREGSCGIVVVGGHLHHETASLYIESELTVRNLENGLVLTGELCLQVGMGWIGTGLGIDPAGQREMVAPVTPYLIVHVLAPLDSSGIEGIDKGIVSGSFLRHSIKDSVIRGTLHLGVGKREIVFRDA